MHGLNVQNVARVGANDAEQRAYSDMIQRLAEAHSRHRRSICTLYCTASWLAIVNFVNILLGLNDNTGDILTKNKLLHAKRATCFYMTGVTYYYYSYSYYSYYYDYYYYCYYYFYYYHYYYYYYYYYYRLLKRTLRFL